MKNQKSSIAISLGLSLALFTAHLSAQTENIWRGGKPGRIADWNIAANWSQNRVPNEFDHVVIPNTDTSTRTYPFITGDVVVASLHIEPGAEIILRDQAMLAVLHLRGCEESATLCAEPDVQTLRIDTNKAGEVIAYQGVRQ